jgi:hypothetical protein
MDHGKFDLREVGLNHLIVTMACVLQNHKMKKSFACCMAGKELTNPI